MLILLTIFVAAATLLSIAILLKNRQTLPSNSFRNLEAPPYRPLFAPDEDGIRAFEREEKARLQIAERENAKRAAAEKFENIKIFQNGWQAAPDRRKTVELLRLAAESENGQVFAEISLETIKLSNENRIKNLPPEDLADLLDSHFRTLPQQERTSGVLYRLREEIAGLRRRP